MSGESGTRLLNSVHALSSGLEVEVKLSPKRVHCPPQ